MRLFAISMIKNSASTKLVSSENFACALARAWFLFCKAVLFSVVVVHHGHIKTKMEISPARLPLFSFFVLLENLKTSKSLEN
jgi:hypothetical protein